MNKIKIYSFLSILFLVVAIIFATIFEILKYNDEKKAEQIAAEKADQMYYEEVFPELKMNLVSNDPFIIIPDYEEMFMNLFARNPTIIIPAYNEKFILMHPELKKYFVRKVSPQEIFSTKLNIEFKGLEIEIQSSKEQVMSDSCNITNPFQSLKNVVAFSCRDWSANPEDAWIYGIIIG